MIEPMLCQELKVNGILENGLDAEKVTKAYRNAIARELVEVTARGFVAERKGRIAAAH